MKGFLAVAALAGTVLAAPQAASSGCMPSVSGTFGLSVVNVTKSSKRELERRQVGNGQYTMQGGIFKDSQGRTGEIVANHQFQFDPQPQAGYLYASGWSVCSNGSIAINGNAIFYQCLSGTFYNLYDMSQGNQCSPVYIVATGMGASPAGPSGTASQVTDGQVQATTAKSSAKVSQISDGQVQATTKASAGVSQISDGQVQAPTSKPQVSQISDGQVQVTTAKPSSSGAKVSQISDGQVQAPTSKPQVSQISDGQIQVTTAKPSMTTSRAISQISDGQIQAPTSTKPMVATFTGAAARVGGSFAFVAGVVGAVAML